jgi:arsenate reductase-like glutaredoxin family protein
MTANELAEWIENSSPYGDYATAKKAVAMLRQQQAEIEALKLRELTDEEIDKIIKQHDWYSKSWVDMVRSIESAILKKARN